MTVTPVQRRLDGAAPPRGVDGYRDQSDATQAEEAAPTLIDSRVRGYPMITQPFTDSVTVERRARRRRDAGSAARAVPAYYGTRLHTDTDRSDRPAGRKSDHRGTGPSE